MTTYTAVMDQIPAHELHEHTDEVLARVTAGETVEITKDGEPVARLVRVTKDQPFLERMIAAGRATPATLRGPIPMPPTSGDPTLDVAAALAADREEERW
jgi:prevent-host-death family protein